MHKNLLLKVLCQARRRRPTTPRRASFIRKLCTHTEILEQRMLLAAEPLTQVDAAFFGSAAFGESKTPSISLDGQLIVFQSNAENLVPNDVNGESDVFLFNRATNTVSLVSVSLDGTAAGRCNEYSAPVISPDGRYVAFESRSENALVAGIKGDAYYLRDLQLGTTLLLTPNADGTGAAIVGLYGISFAADGRSVLFVSTGTNAIDLSHNLTGEAVSGGNIFKRDLQTNLTTLISIDQSGKGGGIFPGGGVFFTVNFATSANGRYVTFLSDSSNYVANDNNDQGDVFLRDTLNGTTTLVSSAKLGGFVAGSSTFAAPTISSDGRYVTFVSDAVGVTSVIPNGSTIAYVRDMQLGVTTAISARPDQTVPSFSAASNPVISANGSTVVFANSSNLLLIDNNSSKDVYAYSLSSRSVSLVSVNNNANSSGNADSGTATYLGAPPLVITPNGRYVVFRSGATNLLSGVIERNQKLYRRDLQSGITTLLTVSSTLNSDANADSEYMGSSSDGRFITFQSSASNLVQNDTNFRSDVFVRDVLLSTNSMASVRSNVLPLTILAEKGGTLSSISADGKFVVFTSLDGIHDAAQLPSNFAPGQDIPYVDHILLRNTETQAISFVDVSPVGAKPLGGFRPRINANGNVVAFESNADLDANHSNAGGRVQVFARDLTTGITTMVSRTPSGSGSTGSIPNNLDLAISPEGRYIVWQSTSSDLVPGMVDNSGGQGNVFLYDRNTGVTKLVSHAESSPLQSGNGSSKHAVFSSDGASIAFVSQSRNLVNSVADTNNDFDLFVYKIATGNIILASVNANGTSTGDRVSGNPDSLGGSMFSFSSDGRFLIFASSATNLNSNDSNGRVDVFRRDLIDNKTVIVSINSQSTASGTNGDSFNPSVSNDGQRVSFQSTATDLVAGLGSSGLQGDAVYVRDFGTGFTSLVSAIPGPVLKSGNNASRTPVISPDGRYVSFTSFATDLVSGFVDGNGGNGYDLFIRDLQKATTTLVSVNQSGTRSGASQFVFNQPDVRLMSATNTLFFNSTAPDLVPGDRNQSGDVFAFKSFGSSSIAGQVFVDDNKNGQPDIAEKRLRDWIVYIDSDNDDQLDPNESRLQTSPTGQYAFTNLSIGRFVVRVQSQAGYVLNTPASGSFVVDIASDGQATIDCDFGQVVPRPDLEVTSLTPIAAGRVGGIMNVSWTVKNSGLAAQGEWQDAVYISQTPTLVGNAILLTTIVHSGGLAAGAHYDTTAAIAVPSITPGNYYVIVQVDRRAQVSADPNRLNNVSVASSPTLLDATLIQIGQTYSLDSFDAPGQQFLYKIVVPQSSGSMTIDMESQALTGGTSLYLRRSLAPTAWEYDQASRVPESLNQSLVSPKTTPGTYYLLVRAESGAAATAGFTLRVELPTGLKITRIDTSSVSHSAQATIEIHGFNLSPSMQAKLLAAHRTIVAESIDFRDASLVYATFNTGGPENVGTYELVVQDGTQSSNAIPFQIVVPQSNSDSLAIDIEIPSGVRHHGQVYAGAVRYTNTGNSNFPAQLLQLTSTHARLQLPTQLNLAGTFENASIQFLATAPDGPAGILRPGQSGIQVFYFQPGPDSTVDFDVGFEISMIESGRTIDWPTVLPEIRPSYIQEIPWQILSNELIKGLGTTTDEYVQRLGKAATYLSEIDSSNSNVQELWSFMLAQADGIIGFPVQESVQDLIVAGPGLSLSLTRNYLGTISNEYRRGIFGLGWSSEWESKLLTDAVGNVTVFAGAASRFFEFQPDGSYRGGPGEYGTLARSNGIVTLTEIGGEKAVFLANGKLNYVEDTNSNRITLGYNAAGQLVTLNHSSGQSLFLTYTADTAEGLVSQVTDSSGRKIQYTYETILFGGGVHLTGVDGPLGTTRYRYQAGTAAGYQTGDGMLIQITRPDGTNQFSSSNTNGGEFHRDGGAESSRFVSAGEGKFLLFDAFNNQSTVWLNPSGQLSKIMDANGDIASFSYDNNSNLIRSEDPLGASKKYAYNANGGLTKITNPMGNSVHLVYGGPYQGLTNVVDARGNATKYSYDSHGNLATIVYPGGGFESFQYDSLGNPREKINRRGDAIRSTKDTRGRTTRIDFSDTSFQTFTYDNFDNLLTASDSSGTISLRYANPENSRLTRIDYPNNRHLEFTYDAGGRRTQSVDQDGFTIAYAFDAVGRLSDLLDGSGNRIVHYVYDDAGNLIIKENGNGTTTTYGYDSTGLVVSIKNYQIVQTSPVVNSSWTYTYDAAYRVSSSTDDTGTTTYRYDAIGQLKSAALPNGRTISYDYDATGNRTRVIDSQLGTTTYSVNSENEITQTIGPDGVTSYSYDADGHLRSVIAPSGSTTYTFDALDQLKLVSGPKGTSSFSYNAFGDRISATIDGLTTSYLVDPAGLGNVVATYGQNNATGSHYVHGIGLVSQVSSAGVGYYDFDITGNTTGITDASGSYVNRYSYLPFGETTSAVTPKLNNPFTFVGSFGVMQEANGLSFMRARYYSPITGQFVSNDPIGLLSGDFNRRRYVGNSPLEFVDPMGLKPLGKTAGGMVSDHFWDKAQEFAQEKWDDFTGKNTLKDGEKDIAKGAEDANSGNRLLHDQLSSSDDTYAAENYTRGQNLRSRGVAKASVGGAKVALRLVSDSFSPGIVKKLGSALNAPHVPTLPELAKFAKNLSSIDPNDFIGPSGFGSEQFVDPSGRFLYTIEFENLPTATAPALEVVLTHQLDSDLDFSTFELGSFGFGSVLQTVPSGLQQFRTTVDYHNPDGSPLSVSVSFEFDQQTGLLIIKFDSIDPVIGAIPIDALAGFLPPEDGSKRGQGFFQFTVKPKQAVVDGTRIEQSAIVYFDGNPLVTPTYVNTTDGLPPTASIRNLAPLENASFTVHWSGNDFAGSGIALYDVFVSDNSGPYVSLSAATQATSTSFNGQASHTYAFYVVAIDNIGHSGRSLEVQTKVSTNSWQNASNPLDVDHDFTVSPLDVLVVINEIQIRGSHALLSERQNGEFFLDPDGDRSVSPLDVLIVINYINRQSGGGEGESSTKSFIVPGIVQKPITLLENVPFNSTAQSHSEGWLDPLNTVCPHPSNSNVLRGLIDPLQFEWEEVRAKSTSSKPIRRKAFDPSIIDLLFSFCPVQ